MRESNLLGPLLRSLNHQHHHQLGEMPSTVEGPIYTMISSTYLTQNTQTEGTTYTLLSQRPFSINQGLLMRPHDFFLNVEARHKYRPPLRSRCFDRPSFTSKHLYVPECYLLTTKLYQGTVNVRHVDCWRYYLILNKACVVTGVIVVTVHTDTLYKSHAV